MKIISVTDRRQSFRPFTEQISAIVQSGIDMLVLREKDLSPEEYRALAEEVSSICQTSDVRFCINTFSDIAGELNVDTVWIPFPDLIEHGRPDISTVGVSVHSLNEAISAEEHGADFIVYGNVFETTCKPGKEARGFSELKQIIDTVSIPAYAIGGINADNIAVVQESGADGACIMSGLMKSENPDLMVREIKKRLE